MSKKEQIIFTSSGADWVAIYKGRIIAETPILKGQKEVPRSLKQIAKMYVKSKTRKLM